jgi:pimeloyl-ACP methyl ester carboxylesterase
MVDEHLEPIAGWADEPWTVFWRTAAPPASSSPSSAPVLYLHGNPTSSDDWLPFLARTGGVAPDLPGWGRSWKRGDGDFTMEGLGRFVGAFADALGLDRVRLVVHDWGGVGLLWAMAAPERIERLVVVDSVPFLPGYRWHRWARVWRARGLGELSMGFAVRPLVRRLLPGELGAQAAPHWDEGTQRAVLRLYRSAPEARLAAAGEDLACLRDVPSLVVWGGSDPYLPPRFADAYAQALGAEKIVRPGAGHWPWVDDPSLVDEVVAFLG